jgi:hypothetical protein
MHIYLAGDVQDHEKFRNYASSLKKLGYEVVSTWFLDGHMADLLSRCDEQGKARKKIMMASFMAAVTDAEQPELDIPAMVNPELAFEASEALRRCKREIDSASVVIAFMKAGSFEAGYAFGTRKTLITVGDLDSPLSHYTRGKSHAVDTWADGVARLNLLSI